MSACLAVITTLGNSSSLFPTKTFRVNALFSRNLPTTRPSSRVPASTRARNHRTAVHGGRESQYTSSHNPTKGKRISGHSAHPKTKRAADVAHVDRGSTQTTFFFQPEKPKHKNHNDAHTPSWTIILVVWILVVRFL